MEGEKVKEIKEIADFCIERGADCGCCVKEKETDSMLTCRSLMKELLTLINELEKENARLDIVVKHNQELIEDGKLISSEQLKQFSERLKEDFIKKKNGLLKAREIGASNDNFIMVDSLNCKIDGLQYAIDNIDETLKECLK